MKLRFHNTLGRETQDFTPLDPGHVRVYACGPTVYDNIHVGNARPLVVFDVLVRLLRHHFPKVTYVRNITDIDDKINARAAELGVAIGDLTQDTIVALKGDCDALNTLPPDVEPRATDHIPQITGMIRTLIDKGHAYEAEAHVLFEVSSMPAYGRLSRHSRDELVAGARVEVAPFKRDPADFVLWKPSSGDQPGWDSPWGRGRPGWHIECSAMSAEHLGERFDIHAGGLDLVFPHHENEIAQSCCAHGTDEMARLWMHNGYVTVGGEKMAKSLGNFTTVRDALAGHPGEAVRYALLTAHYRAPLDFSIDGVVEAKAALAGLYRAVDGADGDGAAGDGAAGDGAAGDGAAGKAGPDAGVLEALGDDLNTPKALSRLHELARMANKGDAGAAASLNASARLLGVLEGGAGAWFRGADGAGVDEAEIKRAIEARLAARKSGDFEEADRIRDALADKGVVLEDGPDGTVWRRGSQRGLH